MPGPDLSHSGERLRVTIGPEEGGERLDRYLLRMLTGFSRSAVQRLIDEGAVLVNGRPRKAGYALRSGDEIEAHVLLVERPVGARPQEIPLDIVYEDEDLLVINKPAGMVVHPAPGHHEGTLVNALLAYRPELRGVGGEERPGIVHRLDKDTSGLLLVAKNARTLAALGEMMQRRQIRKRYLALVEGHMPLEQGSIEAPIGRDPRHRQQMAVTVQGSREARTHFRVLQRFARHTLLLLELETGRTHQIRVHLKAIGHPIAGDPVYGAGKAHKERGLQRQFLHACQLQFRHPFNDTLLEFEAPLPEDLQAVLSQEKFL